MEGGIFIKRLYAFLLAFFSAFFLIFINKITLNPSESFIRFSVVSASSRFMAEPSKASPFISKSSLILKGTLPNLSLNKEKKTPKDESLPVFSSDNTLLPPGIQEITILKGGTSLSGIEINNETDYDLQNAHEEKELLKNSEVLIVHTHTSEAYRPTEKYHYEPTDNQRSEDTNFNVAKVGEHLSSQLSSQGIKVTHDKSINDYPSYNGSYLKTLKLIEAHLEKNPSINIVLDLHRDAMIKSDGTHLSAICDIDGKKAAQIMIVVGTDQSGLSHPNWKSNFSFAVKLQKVLNEKYPGLMRPLNVRCERFNGHINENEIIIEIGTTGNTLEEALISAELFADGLSSIIKDS